MYTNNISKLIYLIKLLILRGVVNINTTDLELLKKVSLDFLFSKNVINYNQKYVIEGRLYNKNSFLKLAEELNYTEGRIYQLYNQGIIKVKEYIAIRDINLFEEIHRNDIKLASQKIKSLKNKCLQPYKITFNVILDLSKLIVSSIPADNIRKLDLSPRTISTLNCCGIISITQLKYLISKDLLSEIRNIGEKATSEILQKLCVSK